MEQAHPYADIPLDIGAYETPGGANPYSALDTHTLYSQSETDAPLAGPAQAKHYETTDSPILDVMDPGYSEVGRHRRLAHIASTSKKTSTESQQQADG